MSRAPAAPPSETPARDAPEEEARYAGLATRVISFVVDAAVINVVAIVIGLGATLVQGVLHFPTQVQTIWKLVGAGMYVLGTIGYFVIFWSSTGQTPGERVMQIRVLTTAGTPVKPGRAFVRCVGVVLAALPLFAGFVPILFNRRRRGFQDRLAGTVVVQAPQLSLARSRRLSRRAPGAGPDPPAGVGGVPAGSYVSGDDRGGAMADADGRVQQTHVSRRL